MLQIIDIILINFSIIPPRLKNLRHHHTTTLLYWSLTALPRSEARYPMMMVIGLIVNRNDNGMMH